MQTRVSFHDYFGFGISIDAKGTIQDIQKFATMYGGSLTVYDMTTSKFSDINLEKPYRISYRLNKAPFEIFIYGIELTEDEYNTQILAWNGKESVSVEAGSNLTLIDNSYLMLR
jgi:hypothetical protein